MANVVQEKSEALAVRIVNLWKYLLKHQEYDISRQVKRSGTSVGANICEALYAASKKDFLNKIYIAYKELGETKYWLRVLNKTDLLENDSFTSLYSDDMTSCPPNVHPGSDFYCNSSLFCLMNRPQLTLT